MIRLLNISFLLILALAGYSQEIIIQPPLISPFECTEFYKLYTGSVTNFSSETFQTKLMLEVDYTSPAGNSQRLADGILSGNPSVNFTPGMTPVNNVNYESLYTNRNITFYDKEIENLLARTKCLPPGQYDVCLTLLDATVVDGSQGFLTQTCYTREKQMLSNLLLVSPFEGDEVSIDMPLFTWTPVTPINPGAIYHIQIVEMLANQTPFEAFRSNPIFFEQSGLMSNIFQYPVAARTMLPCTQYAWRVTYELGGGFINTAFQKAPDFLQESEIWEFHRPCDEDDEEEEDEESCVTYTCFLQLPDFFQGLTDHLKGDFTKIDIYKNIKVDLPFCFEGSPFIQYYLSHGQYENQDYVISGTINSVSADIDLGKLTLDFGMSKNLLSTNVKLALQNIISINNIAIDHTSLDGQGLTQSFTCNALCMVNGHSVSIEGKGTLSNTLLGKCCQEPEALIESTSDNTKELNKELWLDNENTYYDPLWEVDPCKK